AKIGGKVIQLTPKGKEYGLKYLDEHNAELQLLAQRKAEELKEEKKNNKQTAQVVVISGQTSYKKKFAVKIGGKYVDLSDEMFSFETSDYTKKHLEEMQAKAQELLDEYNKEHGDGKGWKPEMNIGGQRKRVGKDWREGRDVSATELMNKFGFRGVEFGNYVTQKERQRLINECYDAFMDMADVLGVSPKALSLNGNLGMAIGARGIGGAVAHYEPAKNVINLTKKNGWGALAHEWWHSLDYYFGQWEKAKPATASYFKEGVRKEMKEAFEKVMDRIKGSDYLKRSRSLDRKTNKDYYSKDTELGARAFQDYIEKKLTERGQVNDFLSHFTTKDDWNGERETYPYPIEEEGQKIGDAFESFFDTIQEREGENGNVVLFQRVDDSAMRRESDAVEEAMRDEVVRLMREAGIEVSTDWEAGQRILDDANADLLREMRAYHGSGADFNRFDHSHMGEGEGAQAYGWGTYVTEIEGVGRMYAETNGNRVLYKSQTDSDLMQSDAHIEEKTVVGWMLDGMKYGSSFKEMKSKIKKELTERIKYIETDLKERYG
ncbi:MAG: hypothetical protein IIT85_12125, partial [Prevotella sp.]|nr:hypothetical protein [Prevotella sp.]